LKGFGQWNKALLAGVAYNIAAPSRRHQEVSGELFYQIRSYLADKTCRIYTAPFDVRLSELGEEDKQIKEYWIVHPIDNTIMVFILGEDQQYGKPGIFTEDNQLKSRVFADLKIDLKQVFGS
jgi:hypothetical protein